MGNGGFVLSNLSTRLGLATRNCRGLDLTCAWYLPPYFPRGGTSFLGAVLLTEISNLRFQTENREKYFWNGRIQRLRMYSVQGIETFFARL